MVKILKNTKIYKLIKSYYSSFKRLHHVDPHPIIKVNNRDVVFIHILKTAGTSVINAIGQDFKLHLPVTEVVRRVGENNFNNAYSFSFVRNPWDKVYSHYNYNVKTNQHNMKTHPIEFNEWVKKCFGKDKDYFYYHRQIQFTNQLTWLKDASGNVNLDFIGKFENLHEDFNKISKALGIENKLPHLNKTAKKKKAYIDVYNTETKNIIAEVFKEDIEYFNYKFGE